MFCVILPVSQPTNRHTRARQKLPQETHCVVTAADTCARWDNIFFPSSYRFFSVELYAAEAIASPDEIFPRLAVSSALRLLRSNDAKKNISRGMKREHNVCAFSANVQTFLWKKKEEGGENSSVITPSSAIGRVWAAAATVSGNCIACRRCKWERKISRIEFERENARNGQCRVRGLRLQESQFSEITISRALLASEFRTG